MRFVLERKWKKDKYIIGVLSIDGEFVCNTLERPWLNNAPKVSCIPEGLYEVKYAYSPKFQRNLPRILNVPGRSGILIHRGNFVTDSSGCILVGMNTVKGKVTSSTKYELQITEMLRVAQSRGEKSEIWIK